MFTDRTGQSVISASEIELEQKPIPRSVNSALKLLPDSELLQAPRPIAKHGKINRNMAKKRNEIGIQPLAVYN